MATRDNHSINALRALAALVVVFSHVRTLFFRDYSQVPHSHPAAAFYAAGSLGHGAVMVFFALSGFWVGGSVLRGFQRKGFSWREYGLRRGVRLWIVLLPALVLTGVLDHIGLAHLQNATAYQHASGYVDLPTDLPSHLGATTAAGNAVFVQAIRSPTYGTNGPLWSLAYEFWFYLLFPLLLFVFTAKQSWRNRLVSAVVAAAIALLVGHTVLEYFLAWLLGTVVAWRQDALRVWISRTNTRAVTALRALAVVALGATLLADKAHQTYSVDFVVAAASALLLTTLVTDVQWRGSSGQLLRGFSRYAHSSYSVYAIHLPVAVILTAIIVPNIDDRWSLGPGSLLAGAGLMVLLAFIGWLFALVTEKRTDAARRWLARLLPGAPSIAEPVLSPAVPTAARRDP
jgi:peptidoglycan/LPS O-acetylase OafA/YrhL